MAAHSSIPAREIPQTEEPRGLQFMGSQRVKYNSATKQQQPFTQATTAKWSSRAYTSSNPSYLVKSYALCHILHRLEPLLRLSLLFPPLGCLHLLSMHLWQSHLLLWTFPMLICFLQDSTQECLQHCSPACPPASVSLWFLLSSPLMYNDVLLEPQGEELEFWLHLTSLLGRSGFDLLGSQAQ